MRKNLEVSRVESFRLDADTHTRIESAAREMGVRRSTLFRVIVREWLREQEP